MSKIKREMTKKKFANAYYRKTVLINLSNI